MGGGGQEPLSGNSNPRMQPSKSNSTASCPEAGLSRSQASTARHPWHLSVRHHCGKQIEGGDGGGSDKEVERFMGWGKSQI